MSWLRGTCWAVGRPGLPLTLSCSHSQSCRSLDTTARAPGLHPLSSRPSAPLMQTWLHALAQPTCYCPSAWLWDTSDPLLGRSSPTTLWARPSAPAGPSDRRPPDCSEARAPRSPVWAAVCPSGTRGGRCTEGAPRVCGPQAARPALPQSWRPSPPRTPRGWRLHPSRACHHPPSPQNEGTV